jgi:hypothetical protein
MMHLSLYLTASLGAPAYNADFFAQNPLLRFAEVDLIASSTDILLLKALALSTSNSLALANLLSSLELDLKLDAERTCLLAQPVNLQLQRDSFSLSQLLKLTPAEYATLTDLLNMHFKVDDIRFVPSATAQYWYVVFNRVLDIATHGVQAVTQQNVVKYQASGADANLLLQVSNQVQMLLHEHAINQVRTASGQLELNSLWLSGEGELSANITDGIDLIGQGVFFESILAYNQKSAHASFDTLLNSPTQQAFAIYDDIQNIDSNALFNAVKTRKIKQLDLYLPMANATLHARIKPWDCWKFWRKPFDIQALLAQY